MLSIAVEEIIPILLARQLSPAARAKIDLGFEEAAGEFKRACERWRAEFADDQAQKAEERLPFADQVRLRTERAARRGTRDNQGDVLLGCALQAWLPVHQALCDLGDSEYGRYDIRTLSQLALALIVRKIDRAYDRDLHFNVSRKPPLLDSASETLTPWAETKVEQHDLWVEGQAIWRAIAERHATPAPAQIGATAAGPAVEAVECTDEAPVPNPPAASMSQESRAKAREDCITKRLDDKGWSLGDFAQHAVLDRKALDRHTVDAWRQCKTKKPYKSTLKRLAIALDMKIEDVERL